MLMTKLKPTDTLLSQIKGKVFVIACFGCKELGTSELEAESAKQIDEIMAKCQVVGFMTHNYICNPEFIPQRVQQHQDAIDQADTILVFSCGVGVQTIADAYPHKRVVAGSDTYPLPGFQGVTPLEHDCKKCGQCYLNLTGGICPITACSKSLLNGQCGGAKDGKCEVDPNMECGWERIYQKLKKIGRLDAMKCPVQLRDYAVDDEV